MIHYCPHQACAGLDPDNFCFNRKEVKNMDFLDKLKVFAYRTIGLGETIRNPIKTFRELSRYVGRMANQKASGNDKMPIDLFKKAPEAFRKRAFLILSSQGTMCVAKNFRLGWFFFARTIATRFYWQTLDQSHFATLFTTLSTSSSLAGSGASQKGTLYWNPRNMACEALDRFNLSSRRNAGS